MDNDILRKIKIKRSPVQIVKLILLMFLLGMATQIVASYMLTIILDFFPDIARNYNENISALTELSATTILFVCILAPVLEELVFRGLLFSLLSKFIPLMMANLIQALVFGVYHGNVVQAIYAFILGFYIGWILIITGNVIYTIALHIGINVLGMFIDKLIPMDTSIMVRTMWFAIAMLMAVIVLTALGKMLREEK